MLAVGRISSFVTEVGVDTSSLGHWSWMYVGGGGKQMGIVTAYQLCNPKQRTTVGKIVWDQHSHYFEAMGEIRDPRTMFKLDLLSLLCRWKASGDEILLIGDFNKNVYTGLLATALAGEDLRVHELCQCTTGIPLPPTHICGRTPIDAIYATAGLVCSVMTLLPGRMGVGDHKLFIMDIKSNSVIGDVFAHVLPTASRLLNCSSNRIKHNYICVLNQLSNRHLIFKKILRIDQDSAYICHTQVQLQMNKVDLKLEQFMKSSKHTSHKFKRTEIEWSPYVGEWIH
jgi:hypothetical protein